MGELSLTAAALLALFVSYQLWFSNVQSDSVAAEVAQKLEREFSSSVPESQEAEVSALEPEVGFALVYIPRLKSEVWGTPLLEGTGYRALASGLGHYTETELPGAKGNFAIAGHRATNGEPFAYFEQLQKGDLVHVQTRSGWFTYRLIADKKIPNTALWVLDDQPQGLDASSESLITLTTCDPRWNSTQRWAWWGELVSAGATSPIEVSS